MNEIKEKINEMANGLNDFLDSSVEFCPDAPIVEHFPAESIDYVEIDGKIYRVKITIAIS